jgi:predicted nucleic acid-binding protein
MGLMVDTNVFIRFEKSGQPIDLSSWANSQKVYISAVTVSELLVGVHRANTEERRQRRSKLSFPESGSWTLPSPPRAFMPRSMPSWRKRGT